MARQKLVALVVSAVCLAVFALVTVKGMAARERRSFEASRALLDAGAQLVTSELGAAGDDLPETAEHMAVDADLAQQLHLLTGQIATLAAMPRPGERMKALVLAQTTKVNDRLSTLRGELARGAEVDAIALLDEQGLVLLSDSPVLAVGNRVRLPTAAIQAGGQPAVQQQVQTVTPAGKAPEGVETIGGDAPDKRRQPDETAPDEPTADGREAAADTRASDGSEPSADGRETSAQVRTAAPMGAPMPTMDDTQTEAVRGALAGGLAQAALVVDGNITHIGAAPIMFKGKLAGAIVVERRLRSLPKPTGVDPVLSLDGQVRMGRAPEGASVDSNATESAFLLAPRHVRSAVPGLGSVGFGPLFVAPGSVGVWARRFEVPRVPSAVGYVYTDVTPAFAELGGLQLLTLLLAVVTFAIHALLIATSGLGMARGIAAMSDFLGKQQQGLGDGSRLSERNLPAGLHRLARLVNKSLERGSGSTSSIVSARNASLDDVIAHHEPATPDMSELDFGSFAAPKPELSQFKAPTMEMKRPPPPSTAPTKAEGREPPADDRPPGADGRSPMAEPIAPPADVRQPVAARPTAPPPSPALSDPGSAALLASLEELSDSLAAGEDAASDSGRSFTAEAPRPAPKTNGASGRAVPVLPSAVPTKDESAGPVPGVGSAEIPRDVHYREVYQRFVEVRVECGEPTDDLTYDKFTAKLGQSRDAVMAKHACADVRFQVYVKNGKAALKATPVK